MAIDVSRLGPLYAGLGLDAQPLTVQARTEAAAAAAKGLDRRQLSVVLRAAVGAPVTTEELALFRKVFSDKDPTFSAEPASPEMRVLAANVVSAVALSDTALAQDAAITAAAAVLGGLRAPIEDPAFPGLIEDVLADLQGTGPMAVPATSPAISALDLSKQLETVNAATDHSTLQAALAPIFTALATRIANGDESLRRRVDQLAAVEIRLAEQMEMHWWVVNGYSEEKKERFADLSPAEAVLRAARELAGHTKSRAGVRAAAVLLDRIIGPAKAKERLTIAEVATAGSLAWRRSWIGATLTAPQAALCPVTYAVRLATEADDAADWTGRYGRESRTDPSAAFDGLDLALQLYREATATRVLVGG